MRGLVPAAIVRKSSGVSLGASVTPFETTACEGLRCVGGERRQSTEPMSTSMDPSVHVSRRVRRRHNLDM
eukprot:3864793-Pleurochrysis_carterae.AAC.1